MKQVTPQKENENSLFELHLLGYLPFCNFKLLRVKSGLKGELFTVNSNNQRLTKDKNGSVPCYCFFDVLHIHYIYIYIVFIHYKWSFAIRGN